MSDPRRAGCAALIAVILAGGPASAGAITRSATIATAPADWSTTAKVGQFDPSLGSLRAITFGLSGTLTGSIGIESLDPVRSTVDGSLSAAIGLSAPGAGNVLSVSPTVSTGASLAAFDGTIGLIGEKHTAVQTRALGDRSGDWTRDVSFNPFNPKLGTLVSADFTLEGDVKAEFSLQDLGPTAGSYTIGQSALLDLLGPGRTSLGQAQAASQRSGTLHPFSGTDNFAKAFGKTVSHGFSIPTEDFADELASDLALFSKTGPVELALQAITGLSADLPGSADLLSSGLEGAQITLSYTYLPSDLEASGTATPLAMAMFASDAGNAAVPSAVPEPGSLALLAFSLAGFGVLRRRR